MKPQIARLSALRSLMQEWKIDAYLVPSTDPHQSEYVADHYQGRAWLSGFSGSAGTLIVTAEDAGLWTDSRYFIQAEQQLDGTGIRLEKLRVPHTPEYIQWMQTNLPSGARVGIDNQVMSVRQVRRLESALVPCGIELVSTNDILDQIWPNRPNLPQTKIVNFSNIYTGTPRTTKIQQLRTELHKQEFDAYLLVALDEIAWILNIRATDIAYNPLCQSFLLIHRNGNIDWFCDPDRLEKELRATLEAAKFNLHPYQRVAEHLNRLSKEYRVGTDFSLLSAHLLTAFEQAEVIHYPSPVVQNKSIKNDTEVGHLRAALRKDGVALWRLRRWLDQVLSAGKRPTEYQLAQELIRFRSKQLGYQGESFPAIVGYGPNGAIVHYKPDAEQSATIHPKGLLLLDSGGQYLDGTTDCTRTYALGSVDPETRRHFTQVLRGHIQLAMARFPVGTTGVQLDVYARQPLWSDGLNYGHGTGHGVGFFLNVHEGPQSISPNARAKGPQTPFRPGMVTSNEPGYYREGHYGIRIENLILCVADEQEGWLRFETLTMLPIDRSLIEQSLLQSAEVTWLNTYHQMVYEELFPLLSMDEQAALESECLPLP